LATLQPAGRVAYRLDSLDRTEQDRWGKHHPVILLSFLPGRQVSGAAMPRSYPALPLAIFIPLVASSLAVAGEVHAQIAFPGAEGFGRFARGGRGGDVYHVTTLDDDGPGTLRDAVRSAIGPRTIVFDISGTIRLRQRLIVDKSFLTIAGQTAPGDGICICDQPLQFRNAIHIIMRFVRIRLGDENKPPESSPDALTTDDVDHMIFDHITVSWGIDGNHDLRRGGNFTLQWSIYAEALNNSLHHKGSHAMLASFRDLTGSISLHHNLFASSRERHPTLGGSPRTWPDAIADFRNNVVYNVSGATNLANCRINVINNFYRPGPNTPERGLPLAAKTDTGTLKVFLSGNVFERRDDLTADNHLAINFDRYATGGYRPVTWQQVESSEEFDVGRAKPFTESAGDALDHVLAAAGASRPRDLADARLIAGVCDGTHRLIDSQREVGGWPELKSKPVPLDTDRDGMSDAWELEVGLDPKNADDRNGDQDHDGFTNLEEFLNSLAG
jgi:hypothetical protein